MVLLCFFFGPCASTDVRSIRFSQALEYRHSVGFSRAFIIGNTPHRRNHALFESCWRHSVSSDETSKIPLFRRDSCNLVSSSFQAAISTFFPFDILEPFFGPDLLRLCGLLDFCGSSLGPFRIEAFQPIPVRARLLSRRSNSCSACVRRRYRCLWSFAQ